MTQSVQVGAILIENPPLMAKLFGLESRPYLKNWGVVESLDGFGVDRKILAARWNFFFMADEVKVMFFGALHAQKIQNALKRILAKVQSRNFNSLEVTGIVAKSFFGIPYAVVSAHSRHIQESCCLDGKETRRASQRDKE
jgi:hypothetical protein